MGVPRRMDDPTYAIAPNQAFFEFIEEKDCEMDQPPTRLLHELEVGKRYEIVLTNRCGLYRYRMADVLECTEAPKSNTPLLKFSYRRNMVLFIGKTTEAQLMHCTRRYQERLAAQHPSQPHHFLDFSIVEVMDDGTYYRIYIEMSNMDALLEKRTLEGIEAEAAAIWDEELSRANPEYGDDRVREEVQMCRCFMLAEGTFALLRAEIVRQGANPAQVKIPHVAKKDYQKAFLAQHTVRSLRTGGRDYHLGAPAPPVARQTLF